MVEKKTSKKKLTKNEKKQIATELEARYNFVGYFNEGIACVSNNDKWGYVNENGEEIIPCIYELGLNFENGIAVVKKGGKCGIINKCGEVIAPFKYDNIDTNTMIIHGCKDCRLGENGFKIACLNGKYGFLDNDNKEITPFKYDSLDNYYDGYARFELGGKYGYMNEQGKEVIPARYDNLSFIFENEIARAQLDGKWGIINKQGNVVLPFVYDEIRHYALNGIVVKHENKWGFFDKDLREIAPCIYDYVFYLGYGIIQYRKNRKEGIYNSATLSFGPCLYNDIRFFEESGIARVQRDFKWGWINMNSEEIIPYKYCQVSDMENGYAAIKENKNDTWGIVSMTGKVVVPCNKYESLSMFKNGFVMVKLNNLWGFVNEEGKEVIPCQYADVKKFTAKGLAKVLPLRGDWITIDKTGKQVSD